MLDEYNSWNNEIWAVNLGWLCIKLLNSSNSLDQCIQLIKWVSWCSFTKITNVNQNNRETSIIVLHWWQKLAKKWQKIVLPNLLSSDILWGKPNWLSIGRKFSRSSAKLRVRSTTRNWEVKKVYNCAKLCFIFNDQNPIAQCPRGQLDSSIKSSLKTVLEQVLFSNCKL